MTAEVISLARADGPPSKSEMIASIQQFCLKRNFEDALSREEIARLERHDRIDAQRKSLLINLSHYYRDNPRADVAPGVLTFITLLSDNDKGACTMSQAQIAIILYRSRTTIAEAVTRLKASELVRSVNGKAMSYPTIPRAVAKSYNHVVWVAEALKVVATCPVEPTGPHLSRGADRSSTPVPSKRQVSVATCPVEGGQPVGSTGHNFTTVNSEEKRGEPPRQGTIAKVASAMAATFAATILPAAAQPSDPPAQIIHEVAECWQNQKARYDAGVSIHEQRAQRQVWMTPLGVLEVAGDFKAELEKDFPLVGLKEGLSIAASVVQINLGAIKAMQVIRGRFTYRQKDAEDKQKRAAAYDKKAEPSSDVNDLIAKHRKFYDGVL